MKTIKMAVFVSGSGTNCENIIKYFSNKNEAEVALVISDNEKAYALKRAEKYCIPTKTISKKDLKNNEFVLSILKQYDIDFIVLAGFLSLIPEYLIEQYPHRIINIHPALLPKYGGKGMYGHNVHQAVKNANETETGMTVHWVTKEYDKGDIIAQFKTTLTEDDTADTIAEKEHILEMKYFPKVIENIISRPLKTL